jgi:hypothetical protein
MKIKSIIFNVLLIIILICLIYFFIYLNNSNFENFSDGSVFTSSDSSEEVKTTEVLSQPFSIGSPMEIAKDILVNDGSTFNKPLKNANFGYILEAATPEGEIKKTYIDGYYWINIQNIGTKYIYCIMDKKYFGGGWMLAMRSVHNSQNFSYDSQHFKQSTLLNNESDQIGNIIKELNLKESDLTISSIGNKIYDAINIDANKYDAKFDTFNNTKSSEWMAIFYVKDRNGNIIKGGDYPDNNRGWVWFEKNIKIDSKNDYDNTNIKKLVSPLELFQFLDRQKIKDRKMMAKDKEGKFINAQDMGGKFTNATSRKPPMTNILFSSRQKSSNNPSFYGLNYPYYTNKIRWGFFFKDSNLSSSQNLLECIGGIGCTHHSAGNFERPSGSTTDTEFLDRPAEEFRSRSYAVEWYVRENASNCSD